MDRKSTENHHAELEQQGPLFTVSAFAEALPERLIGARAVLLQGGLTIGLLTALALLTGSPFIFPSLGATAFLFFTSPNSPAASPRHALLGHGLALVCGFAALWVVGLEDAPPALLMGVEERRVIACALSLGLTGAAMVLADAAHPPAGATTLIVALGLVRGVGEFLVVVLAVALLAALTFVLHRLAGVPYPLWSARAED